MNKQNTISIIAIVIAALAVAVSFAAFSVHQTQPAATAQKSYGDIVTGNPYIFVTNTSTNCGVTPTLIANMTQYRSYFLATNDSSTEVYVCKSGTSTACTAGTGAPLTTKGSSYEQKVGDFYNGTYTCVTTSGTSTVALERAQT